MVLILSNIFFARNSQFNQKILSEWLHKYRLSSETWNHRDNIKNSAV